MINYFKPQMWHVEERNPSWPTGEPEVLSSFVSRTVAEEVRDELNAEMHKLGQHGHAYICMCDCPNRECKYREGK